MARAHRLNRFALAAVRCAPEAPVSGVGDRVARFPEIGRDTGIRTILQQTAALAALDLVADLGAELEIQPHFVDAPGPVRFHENTVVRICDDVFEVPGTSLERNVGHPNQWYPVPAVGPHTTV